MKAATLSLSKSTAGAAFQSTPPVKAATSSALAMLVSMPFQSTPPVKAATVYKRSAHNPSCISIHAAREGGDAAIHCRIIGRSISIHAAREGGDLQVPPPPLPALYFNPRRP